MCPGPTERPCLLQYKSSNWRFLGKGFDGILEELLFIVFNVIGPQNQTPYSDSCVVQQRGLSGVDSETYTTAMFTPKVWSLVKL